MSVCFSLVCDDCCQAIWIGQASQFDQTNLCLYSGDENVMKNFATFLVAHMPNHRLRCVTDNDERSIDYEDWETRALT